MVEQRSRKSSREGTESGLDSEKSWGGGVGKASSEEATAEVPGEEGGAAPAASHTPAA